MDNKQILNESLDKIMFELIPQIQELVRSHVVPHVSQKDDGSPVTLLDLALSRLVEEKFLSFPFLTFYSEEKYSEWNFPMLVLDPLDGTREYVRGTPEWALSVGLFEDENFKGKGWVYNPNTHECYSAGVARKFQAKETFRGEVSHSEWETGLFKDVVETKLTIVPVGSIAYKLGRLSRGQCDFVVSLRPKNVWDIAGGTLLCQEAGLKFYSQGQEVTKVQKEYLPPLIWCPEELFPELSQVFH